MTKSEFMQALDQASKILVTVRITPDSDADVPINRNDAQNLVADILDNEPVNAFWHANEEGTLFIG